MVSTLYRVALVSGFTTMEAFSVIVFSGIHFWNTTFSTKGFTKLVTVLDALQTSGTLHGGRNSVPAAVAPDSAGSLMVSVVDSRRRRRFEESTRVKADAVAA